MNECLDPRNKTILMGCTMKCSATSSVMMLGRQRTSICEWEQTIHNNNYDKKKTIEMMTLVE